MLSGIWSHRDLSDGDSAEYFLNATAWADHRLVDPLFSPFYTALWGSLQWLSSDAYAVTIAHRVLIALGVSALVLAAARRLLSPGIAWLVAVWWVVVPSTFDTRNEIHLFAMLPLLAAVIVADRVPGRRGRAIVTAILVSDAVLVRNEAVVAAIVWLVICAIWEFRERRGSRSEAGPAGRSLLPYVAAVAVAVPLIALTLAVDVKSRSPGQLADDASFKQDFAFCQHYALGYEERHQGFISRGFTDCQAFMRRDFDADLPSFADALWRNPGAMATHFRWNLELLPYGLEVGLFDRSSGPKRRNPDYVETTDGSTLALLGALGMLALLVTGGVLLWRNRRGWWDRWLRERAWGWAVVGCLAGMGLWVAITTHPAPPYILALTFSLLCALGLCAMALAERWPALGRARAGLPVFALALVVLLPSHYRNGYATPVLGPGRDLAAAVSRLERDRDEVSSDGNVLLAENAYEICDYLGEEERCSPASLEWRDLQPGSVDRLDADRVNLIYVSDKDRERPDAGAVLAALQQRGWQRIAGDGWLLLRRSRPAAPSSPQPAAGA